MRSLINPFYLAMSWILCLATGCGGGKGVDTVAREATVKAGTKFLERQIMTVGDTETAYQNWAWLFTNIGLFLLFIAVVSFIWISKPAALRMSTGGGIFLVTAELISFLGDWCKWLALLYLVVYVVLNPVRAEKALKKIGIKVDINRDGKYGTETYRHEKKETQETDQDKIDTEVYDK